jgi:multiple sugar transport system ATP-binding protein
MAQVILKNVNKVFDNGFKAVIDASFATEDKEFVILVGPSGCGKTTSLRMIAGLETSTSGDIFIGDRRVNDVPPKDRDIAMVFQNYALYPHMTVYENMAFALKLRKYPKSDIERHVRESAALLNIDKLLDRKPKQLSGGQLQRVALGRAIVRHPQVFLFDEPLSNLDAKLRVQMRSEIVKLHRTLETTMIYVTHDQVEAMTMGSKIVVMKDGVIQQIASPLDIYNHPANLFVAGFIGSPAINVIPGRIVEEDGKLYFIFENHKLETIADHRPILLPYLNREIVLGLRPENIYDARYDTLAEFPQRFSATVELVEPLGNEFIVYMRDPKLTARIDPKEMPQLDKPLMLTLDMKKAHFFDPSTEMCVKESC